MKLKIAFLGFIILSLTTTAQKWEAYNIAPNSNSIGWNNILSGTLDKQGNIWFGTERGVSKFDGSSFTNYSTSDGLINDIVKCIAVDSIGNIWFGTEDGVSKYSGNKFINYTYANGLGVSVSRTIKCIAIDSKGNKWFGTDNGLTKYNDTSFVNIAITGGINTIAMDKGGFLWIGGFYGLRKFDGVKFLSYNKPDDLTKYPGEIKQILIDKKNIKWLICSSRLATYNDTLIKYFGYDSGLKSIALDLHGNVWYATNNIIYNANTYETFTQVLGRPLNNVTSIMVDKSDNKWVCTYGDGVVKYKDKVFSRYEALPGRNSSDYGMVRRIIPDPQGNLWFALSGGVVKYDGTNFQPYTSTNELIGHDNYDIAVDRQSNVWLASEQGLTIINGTKINYKYSYYVTSVTADSKGNVWYIAGASQNKITKYDGITTNDFLYPFELGYDGLVNLTIDNQDNLWMSGYGSIAKFNGISFSNYSDSKAFSYSSCAVDSGRSVWIPRGLGGISKFNGASFKTYTKDDGLQDKVIYSVAIEKDSTIWMGLEAGASRFDGKNFVNFDINNSPLHGYIRSIGFDIYGNTWFGADSGRIWKYGDKSLKVSATALNLDYTDQSKTTFNIISNVNWSIKSNQSWLSINKGNGSGNDTITVTASANPSFDIRTATVNILVNGSISKTITLTQSESAYLFAFIDSLNIKATAEDSSFLNIFSNTNWNVSSNQSWLSLDKTSGSNSAVILIKTLANNTTSSRLATVTITGNGVVAKTIVIEQSASPTVLSVSTNNLNITSTDTASFDIVSNVDWDINSEQPWLIINKTSGSNNAKIIITALPNNTNDSRTATVIVSSNGIPSQAIVLEQPASPKVLSVSTNILNITSPDSVNFDISSNVDWDINSDQPWLIINKTSGSNNAKIIITALPNNTNDSRTATVIVSGKNITSQSIMITQAGVNNTNVIKISGFDVQVYPSPVTDELIVSFSEIIPQTTILIYSLYGDKIFYSAINTKTIKVDLSNLPSGIYFIQYRVRGAVVQTKKIIKQ